MKRDLRIGMLLVWFVSFVGCEGGATVAPVTDVGVSPGGQRLEARVEGVYVGPRVDSLLMMTDTVVSRIFADGSRLGMELAALADEEPRDAVIQLASTTASISPLKVSAWTQYVGSKAEHTHNVAITTDEPANDPPPWIINTTPASGTSIIASSPPGIFHNFLYSSESSLTASVACGFRLSASTTHHAWWDNSSPWPEVNEFFGFGPWGDANTGTNHAANGPSCVTTQQPGGGGGDDTMLEPDEQWYLCTTFYVYVGGVLAQIIDGGCTPV